MLAGVDIGGTKCACVLGDENGNIIKKIKFKTTTLNETLENILNGLEELKNFSSFNAVGISCGGPLNSELGTIQSPPNLPGWDNVPIVKIITDKYNVPAYLCNDANAGALAEWRFGAGKGSKNMAFLTFGTGLGAGLILNGELYCGTNDMAGEVGHIRLEDDGPKGYNKYGSFEGFCSGGGMAQIARKLVREAYNAGKPLPFLKSEEDIDKIDGKEISDWVEQGDETAKEVFKIVGEHLGKGLSVLIDILNLETIVIGSLFTWMEDYLRPHMEKVLKEETLSQSLAVCKIVPAKLNRNIGDIAALTLAEIALKKAGALK